MARSRKNLSPEVDAYIEQSAPFAQPILKRLRKVFHEAHPEIEETMKWSFPHFEYKGILGSMAAFKKHVSYGFWKGTLMNDPARLFQTVGKTSMNAAKVTRLTDLPSNDVLLSYIAQAILLNETNQTTNQTVSRPKSQTGARRTKRTASNELPIPEDFQTVLKKSPRALAIFEKLSPSHRKEYVQWMTEAKREATRQRRLAKAVEWLSEGKPRHGKYI